MASRLDLQTKLENILGSKNVYFQPPENLKLSYPCFIYSLNKIDLNKANNAPYIVSKSYTLNFIHQDADNPLTEELLFEFDYISHIAQNKSNNMYHDVYHLYF